MGPDFLIVGLGNPGKKYKKTRHNVGFMICEYIASFFGLTFRFGPGNSQVFSWSLENRKVMVARPLTFMNLSGEAVAALLQEYDLAQEKMLVLSDDFTLPLGTIRIRAAGSAGNHNGLQSIIDHLDSREFPRMRIGILGDEPIIDPVAFVLGNFRNSELQVINRLMPICVAAIRTWIFAGIERAMSEYNQYYNFAEE